jgi:DNA polymerase-3 subunit beta
MIGHDGGDYPAIPELDGDAQVSVDDALVKHAIQKTSFAVSKDALRPAMMGIYFQIGADGGRTVATDGHRLVRMNMEALSAEEPISFIVPEKALGLAARSAGQGGGCKIRVSQSHVGFDFGPTQVRARLIDESYPNYEAVIPRENDKRLVVGRDAMLAAVKRVSLYSSNMTNQIRLEMSAGKVKIAAEDIERSSQAHETVLCEYDAEAMTIGFNANYLTEVLSNVSAEDVVFEFSSPNRAGVVTPGEQPSGEDILMLIMPVMLNTYA